jgi:hypothetical protein
VTYEAHFADPLARTRMQTAIVNAVEESFVHPGGTRTTSEVRRRAHLATANLKVMLNDLGWSLTRAVDHVAPVLVAALDGTADRLLTKAIRKGWVVVEQKTDAGLVLPSDFR